MLHLPRASTVHRQVRFGLLSDSHGRAGITRSAVKLLVEAGAEMLIFLGDAGSAEVLEALVAARDRRRRPRPAVHVVWGNIDRRDLLGRCVRELGMIEHGDLGRIEAGGKTLVFTHGDQKRLLLPILAEGPDYLLHGHTHRVRDERIRRTRIINPGALFRARKYTVALLDVKTDGARFLEVPRN